MRLRWTVLIFLTSIALSLPGSALSRKEDPPVSFARNAIFSVFGDGSVGRIAVCIATRESSLNKKATGSAGERGLFQIHPGHFRENGGFVDHPVELWLIWRNVKVAWRLSRQGTYWYPWVAQRGYCW